MESQTKIIDFKLNSMKEKVFFVCCGVGHIQRGYETHMTDLFEKLYKDGTFNLLLLKGGGYSTDNIKRIHCIKRNSYVAGFIFKIFGKPGYLTEQISFFFSSIFFILRNKPSVIYCPDFVLLRLYALLKRIFKVQYITILCNGGNYKPPYYGIDQVQFILPEYANDINFKNKVIIPHGFDSTKFKLQKTKYEYRNSLGLPQGKKIVLSVGALNSSVKRMDYVINEISCLKDDNIFLLMVGQRDEESDFIESLAKQKLEDNFLITTVPYNAMPDYYHASDIFCLASLHETFGKVYVEAGLSELPIFIHDFDISKQVIGRFGYFSDLNQNGALTNLISDYTLNKLSKIDTKDMKLHFIIKYDWENLKSKYINLLTPK